MQNTSIHLLQNFQIMYNRILDSHVPFHPLFLFFFFFFAHPASYMTLGHKHSEHSSISHVEGRCRCTSFTLLFFFTNVLLIVVNLSAPCLFFSSPVLVVKWGKFPRHCQMIPALGQQHGDRSWRHSNSIWGEMVRNERRNRVKNKICTSTLVDYS